MTDWQDIEMALIQAVPTSDRLCHDCGRTFDLFDEGDADEWYFGHDCEEN
jgi:hypothetical protein